MPRTYVRLKIKPYTPEDLAEALQKIKNGELTITTAAEQYSIPKATLSDNLHSKYSRPTAGRPTIFSLEEEERLADAIRVMEKWGFGLSRQEILEIVAEYVKENQIKTPFKNNTPGPDWFINFRNRHRLSIKKAQPVEYVRKKMTDPFFIFEYFELLEQTLTELDLIDKPQNIWNLDETSLCLDPTRTKVVGAINKPCARTTYGSGKENITVLAGANAEGKKLPPLVIFKGKYVWDEWMAETDDYDFELSYAASPKGWMQTDIFYNYMKRILIPSLGQERPVLLVYDGHSTHVDVKVIELAIENDITILKLPPHTSHLLQPLDIAVFKSFKSKWDAKLVDWQRRNTGTKMAKKIFSKTLADTWQETKPDIIKNGFKKAGICPFNANVIPVEKYDPNAYRRYQIIRKERAQSQQNTSSPVSLKKICIDYFNKQPHETLQKQCPSGQQDETLEKPKSIPTGNVTLLSEISKSDSQMSAFLAKDSNSLPSCLKRGRSDQQNNVTDKPPKFTSHIVIKEPSVAFNAAPEPHLSTASPKIFTFEEAFLKKIQQDKKNNETVVRKKRISKGAEVITKSMSKKEESKDEDKVTKKSMKKQNNKDSQSKNSKAKIVQTLDKNRPSTSGLQKSTKRKRVPSMDSTTSISDLMSLYSDSENLDLDDLEDFYFKEDFTLPNLDNKRRNEELHNISIRKGKGKGKKSSKDKENQNKEEENESDSSMSKQSGSYEKDLNNVKKIKQEKGERYQESETKEDTRDNNENDYKDERNDIFNKNDTVLVRYFMKNKWVYYIGFIENIDQLDAETYYTINFLKTVKKPFLIFVPPKRKDIDVVPEASIVKTIKIQLNNDNKKEYCLCDDVDAVYFEDLEESKVLNEDFTLQNLDNKQRNEESHNISIRKGKGKGKKSSKDKENQNKEEENESDSSTSKQSGSYEKDLNNVKKIKKEKGERYQESETKEDTRDNNENDYKDERNDIFNKNDTVLVRYFMKNKWVYYIGFIENIDQLDAETYYTINFLKTVKKPFLIFVPPKRKDIDVVPEASIVKTIKIQLNNDNKKEYCLCDDVDAVYFEDLEESKVLNEDFTLQNLDNKQRNEESHNISIRKGKGKGKKSSKDKENQNKEEENESDSSTSKQSGSYEKDLNNVKKIKKEKGERYQESETKEDTRDNNENDYKDERNDIFNKNDTVLVRYFMKNKWVYYIGFIENIDQLDAETYYTIDFLKTVKKPFLIFVPPKRKDIDVVPEASIVKTIKIQLNNDNKKEYCLCDDVDAVYF